MSEPKDEKLHKLISFVTAKTPHSRDLGIELVSASAGYVTMSIKTKPELLQFNGFFHGGVLSGLADHTAGAAATSMMPEGKIAVTVSLNVLFIKPAIGEKIFSSAKVISAGTSLTHVLVTIYGTDEQEPFTQVTAIMRTVDAPFQNCHQLTL